MRMPAFPNKGRRVQEYPLTNGAAFKEGAAVVSASGTVNECGADPATILGFALHDAGADPLTDRILVAKALPQATFFIQGDRDTLATDVNQNYGLAKDADGIWFLDTADAVNTRVTVIDVDTTRKYYEISVLTANRQASA